MPPDQVEAIKIDIAEIDASADAMVEQRELITQIAERLLDGSGELMTPLESLQNVV